MVFPVNNLPANAQPWTREVQKRVENIEATAVTNEVNNVVRDAQAANTLKRINTIVTNVFSAGTTEINGYNIKAGTITASSISAGELVGFTIKTAASGTRIELAGTSLTTYYNNGGTTSLSGSVYGNVSPVDSSIAMILSSASGGGYVAVSNDNIDIKTGAGASGAGISVVRNSGITLRPGTGATVSISSGNLSVGGSISGGSISGSGLTVTGATVNGSYTSTGGITVDGSIIRTALISTATTGASITAGGAIVRTSSSARYKQDIENVTFNYEDVLALQPKKFRLKDDVVYNEDAPYHVGFVAEDLANTPLDIFVNYKDVDGEIVPDGVQYLGMTAMLLSAIKQQDVLIKDLKVRIEQLENN